MTEEGGLNLCKIYEKAVDAEDFVVFLQKLRNKHGKIPLAIFLDQLPVHRSRIVKEWWTKLNISPVWNVGKFFPNF